LYFRASPKKENKNLSSASTSFDDFQESINDAWEIGTEDEILRISGKNKNPKPLYVLNLNFLVYPLSKNSFNYELFLN